MLRVVLCSCIFVVAAARAELQSPSPPQREAQAGDAPGAQIKEYPPRQLEISNADEAPRPVRHKGLRIALGIVAGVVLIGAIVAIGVANASSTSSNQTGYNDWGTLVIMRH